MINEEQAPTHERDISRFLSPPCPSQFLSRTLGRRRQTAGTHRHNISLLKRIANYAVEKQPDLTLPAFYKLPTGRNPQDTAVGEIRKVIPHTNPILFTCFDSIIIQCSLFTADPSGREKTSFAIAEGLGRNRCYPMPCCIYRRISYWRSTLSEYLLRYVDV